MTQEDKLKEAKRLYQTANADQKYVLERLFPELKESEDERIRKEIISAIKEDWPGHEDWIAWLEMQGEKSIVKSYEWDDEKKYCYPSCVISKQESEDDVIRKRLLELFKEHWSEEWYGLKVKDVIAWLEKQVEQKSYVSETMNEKGDFDNGFIRMMEKEQKPADKVEPKFKVGDWVIDKQGIVHQIAKVIENVTNHTYGYDIVGGGYFNDNTEGIRLWTIEDAKDGDVLHSTGFHNDCIFIFNRLDNWKFDEPNGDRAVATGYCCLSISADKMEFGIQGPDCVEVNTIKPATNIQRDLLFQKMKEAGYEWDAEKKELKKIEQKPVDKKGMNLVEEEMTPFQKEVFCIIDTAIEEEQGLKQVCDKLFALASNEIKQKPAWSEEDEKYWSIIIAEFSKCAGKSVSKDEWMRCNDWLNSLRDRVLVQLQPKQEWSEEGRNYIADLISYFDGSSLQHDTSDVISWLKSLRPQKQWKPSDEQMEALLSEVSAWTKGCPKQIVLESLYNDLKKL